MNRKTIIINADDVGMHPDVDGAVVKLAEQGVVTSASVMSLGAPDREALDAMNIHGVDLGLHLDFTSDFANRRYRTAHTVKSLIAAAWRRRLDPAHVQNVISEQLDRFEQAVGAPPVFVDGHEHIHQFPVIRETLFDVAGGRYPGRQLFIRNTCPLRWRGPKATIIGMLGARETKRQADARGHRCNPDFGGVYDFSPASDLQALWSDWLDSVDAAGSLIMCHPASSILEGDAISPARVREFRFLASEACAELLEKHRVRVGGWDEALAAH